MKGSVALNMIAIAAIAAGAQLAAAQPGPTNDISVRISWPSKGPDRVAFEDRAQGRTEFTKGAGHFLGHRPRPVGVAYQNVALTYGAEEIPITLRLHPAMHQLALEIEGPAQLPCSRDIVNRLNSRPEGATQAARLRTLVQARHMLRRQVDICADFGRRMLAEAYFWESCSLARDTEFFMVSEEAKTYFLRSGIPTARAEQAIRDCDRVTRVADVRNMNDGRLAARDAGDYARASEIDGALLVLAADDAWRSGFEALRIDAGHIRAMRVADLADWRDLASGSGNPEQALEANRQLTSLSRDPAYRPAFDLRAITPAQLADYRPGAAGSYAAQAPASPAPASPVQVGDERSDRRYGWDRSAQRSAYREGRSYRERPLGRDDRIYRGRDGRYYCRRNDGTTGLVIGAGVGALIGNSLEGGGSSTLGTLVGTGAGAAIGREVNRGSIRCR